MPIDPSILVLLYEELAALALESSFDPSVWVAFFLLRSCLFVRREVEGEPKTFFFPLAYYCEVMRDSFYYIA